MFNKIEFINGFISYYHINYNEIDGDDLTPLYSKYSTLIINNNTKNDNINIIITLGNIDENDVENYLDEDIKWIVSYLLHQKYHDELIDAIKCEIYSDDDTDIEQ